MNDGLTILNSLLSSEVKGDLLVLFHKNPGLIDTIKGVARRIGRRANTIEQEVKDLIDLGVLGTKRIGTSEVIFLDRARDKEIQEIIANYLKNLKKDGGV